MLIEWIAVNGLALVVWLAARRHEGLQKRLRALPVLKVFHEVELTRMERLHLVFALTESQGSIRRHGNGGLSSFWAIRNHLGLCFALPCPR